MEILYSIVSALLGLVLILVFFVDFISMINTGVFSRKQLIICIIKLIAALLLFHAHFEFDILD
ncbi:hypothetical protein SPSYN_02004 [Sporotomaculum syntrophicum]|uniref:Uncharacterized protein n=1 Tax=Sporotomaculum syntrophicum TaxID=182264 RepID=A0A9D2WP31_9FIRM|nr:hypothetical protein SPSYN_02004 [Sporotomaculum syntrophicum]